MDTKPKLTPQEATDLSKQKDKQKEAVKSAVKPVSASSNPPKFKRDKVLKFIVVGIIALTGFFILLNSISNKKKQKNDITKQVDSATMPQDLRDKDKKTGNKQPVAADTTVNENENTAEAIADSSVTDPFRKQNSGQKQGAAISGGRVQRDTWQEDVQPYTLERGYEEPYYATDYKPENDPVVMAHNSRMQPVMDGSILSGQNKTPQPSSSTASSSGAGDMSEYYNALLANRQNMPTMPTMPSLGGQQSGYESQNMQGNKSAFAAKPDGTNIISGGYVIPDTLWSGTVIPAVLITGINTDLPGEVIARVTANVYDSQSGRHLLIPQGSTVMASYNSSVSYAQSRIQIVWNTLTRPDGYQVDLGGMNGIDDAGLSGQKGKYSENYFQYLKAAGIITLFTIANGELTRQAASAGAAITGDMAQANQQMVMQMSNNVIGKALDIQPTITLRSGTKINVMLNKNIHLVPAENYPASEPYKLR